MSAKLKKILISAFCIIWSAILVIIPLAWFTNYWSSEGSKINFTTGGSSSVLPMHLWQFTTEFEDNTEGNYDVWRRYSSHESGEAILDGFKIPSATREELSEGSNTYTYEATSLHFGRIDNLDTLSKDNLVYLCFSISPALNGKEKITLSFDYHIEEGYNYNPENTSTTIDDPRWAIEFYDETGEQKSLVPDEPNYKEAIDYDPAIPEMTQFLQYAYCVTDQLVPPSDKAGIDAFDTLEFSEDLPIGTEAVTVDITSENYTDTYYVYVRLSPRLESFGLQERTLEYFVSSFMLFDTKLELEVH